jgi:hypothetical protein
VRINVSGRHDTTGCGLGRAICRETAFRRRETTYPTNLWNDDHALSGRSSEIAPTFTEAIAAIVVWKV